jgi:preprotein translocase subunit YajC
MFYIFPVATAYAADAAAKPNVFVSMAPLLLLVVVFYFLMIRPQQKKAKDFKEMLSKIEKGDNIVTTGGIYGRVMAVNDDTLSVEIADNVRVKITKSSVAVRKPHES